MLDNLRDDSKSAPFFEDGTQTAAAAAASPTLRSNSRLLGLTPIQRFVIAVLIMVIVCVFGMMCLLVTGKIGFYF